MEANWSTTHRHDDTRSTINNHYNHYICTISQECTLIWLSHFCAQWCQRNHAPHNPCASIRPEKKMRVAVGYSTGASSRLLMICNVRVRVCNIHGFLCLYHIPSLNEGMTMRSAKAAQGKTKASHEAEVTAACAFAATSVWTFKWQLRWKRSGLIQ